MLRQNERGSSRKRLAYSLKIETIQWIPSVYCSYCYCYMMDKISGTVYFNNLTKVDHWYKLVDYVNNGEDKRLTYAIFILIWRTIQPILNEYLKSNYPDILAIYAKPQDMTVIFFWILQNYADRFG